MIWLLNNMKCTMSANFYVLRYCKRILDTAKEIWEAFCDTYFMKKNASRVFKAYEYLSSFRQSDKNIEDNYNHFKSIIDELNQYHPVTNDNEVLRKQGEELYVHKFLSGLSFQLKPLRRQLLVGEWGFSLCRILFHDYFMLHNILQQLLIPFHVETSKW